MEKRLVLFVDDEPNILDGLRRMLRSMRNEFELHYVDSGISALKMMGEKSFDIVVSDMRMPGMDGANFLSEVQKRFPHTIRIMLTGQADEDSVMRAIGVVHQFLAKPCDPDKLKDMLLRSGALHQLLIDSDLKNIVSSIQSLPSLPNIYAKLQEKLKDPDVVVNDVAEIIAKDVAMTAKVMQLVNSAFFGLFQKVETPARAVTLLGLDTIKALVLGLQVFSELQPDKSTLSMALLWEHNMTVGLFAKKITEAECEDTSMANESFISGILHDIGKLIFLTKMGQKYEEAILNAKKMNLSLSAAESDIFKATHSHIGAYLIGLWGFQSNIIEVIGFHHQIDMLPAQTFSSALAVHVANSIYYEIHPEQVIGTPPVLNLKYIEDIGLIEKIENWRNICKKFSEHSQS